MNNPVIFFTAVLAFTVLSTALCIACYEIRHLRAGIRAHRDARGNDRCWVDDEALYRLLGTEHEATTLLPERAVFLENCARFHANRQHPFHLTMFKDVHPGGVTPPR